MAQIAFGCLQDGQLRLSVNCRSPFLVAYLNHDDVVVRATFRTDFTADTGLRVDGDDARILVSCNSASWTANHAYWVSAMHTGMCK